MNIVSQSFAYFDNQNKKYHKYLNSNVKLIQTDEELISEFNLPKCKLVLNNDNSDNKEPITLLTCDYNVIGVFIPENNNWIWGWATYWVGRPFDNTKSDTYLSRQIVTYAFDISEKIKQNIALYTQVRLDLLTSRIVIEHPIHFEKILAIALYITHSDMIFKSHDVFSNAVVYYLLKNVNIIKEL